MTRNVHFTASHAETARAALSVLTARYGQAPLAEADVVVALGGTGSCCRPCTRRRVGGCRSMA